MERCLRPEATSELWGLWEGPRLQTLAMEFSRVGDPVHAGVTPAQVLA